MAEDVEAFTLLALGLVIIGLRVVVRWRHVGPANFQLDDYLMPLAGIICTVDSIAAYLVLAKANGLTNSYMTDEERATILPDSQEYAERVLGSKIQVIGWTLYVAALWCIKACVAVFYSRLTTGLAHLQMRVYVAYALLGITWVVTTFCLLFGCQPMSKYWQINPNPGSLCQPTNSKLYVLSVLIPDVLTDLYLLSIPLPLLWTINLSVKKKASLMLLFSGVVFVIMAAIIRGVLILSSGPEGAITGSEWAVREEFVSIAVANLPILQAPIRTFCNRIGLSVIFSHASTGGRNSQPYEGRTIGGGGYPLRTTRKKDHSVAVAAWESDEQILCENNTPINGIVVAREVTVESESGSLKNQSGYIASVPSSPHNGQP